MVDWNQTLMRTLDNRMPIILGVLDGKTEYKEFAEKMTIGLTGFTKYGDYGQSLDTFYERTREMLRRHAKGKYEAQPEIVVRHGILPEDMMEKLRQKAGKRGIEMLKISPEQAAYIGTIESLRSIWSALYGWEESKVDAHLEDTLDEEYKPLTCAVGSVTDISNLTESQKRRLEWARTGSLSSIRPLYNLTEEEVIKQAQLRDISLDKLARAAP